MLLAIDIGNTNVVAGVFDDDRLVGTCRSESKLDMSIEDAKSCFDDLSLRFEISFDQTDKVVIGSVVPLLTETFASAVKSALKLEPVIVNSQIELPVKIEIDYPDEVGADRIANAAAVFDLYGGPSIVVDFGTATTFDIVSESGAYIGGVIIPGPKTSMAELARRAAKLFDVRIEPPAQVVGKSTEGALKSGLFFGTVGQVDYIIEQIIEETGFENPTIVATGGLAGGIEKYSHFITEVAPDLTLEGLRLIAKLN